MPEPKPMPASSASRLFFSLGDTIFAVAADNVIKIVAMPPVTVLPFLPAGIDGIAAVGGKVIPVLTLPGAGDGGRELVLLKHDDEYGLRADRVLRIADENMDTFSGAAVQFIDITELVARVRQNGARMPGSPLPDGQPA